MTLMDFALLLSLPFLASLFASRLGGRETRASGAEVDRRDDVIGMVDGRIVVIVKE